MKITTIWRKEDPWQVPRGQFSESNREQNTPGSQHSSWYCAFVPYLPSPCRHECMRLFLRPQPLWDNFVKVFNVLKHLLGMVRGVRWCCSAARESLPPTHCGSCCAKGFLAVCRADNGQTNCCLEVSFSSFCLPVGESPDDHHYGFGPVHQEGRVMRTMQIGEFFNTQWYGIIHKTTTRTCEHYPLVPPRQSEPYFRLNPTRCIRLKRIPYIILLRLVNGLIPVGSSTVIFLLSMLLESCGT